MMMIHVKLVRSFYTYCLFTLSLASLPALLSACDAATQTDREDSSYTTQRDTSTGMLEDMSEDVQAGATNLGETASGEMSTDEVSPGTPRATSSVFDTQDCSQCNFDSFSESVLDEMWAECCPMTSCGDGACRLVCKEESDFGF